MEQAAPPASGPSHADQVQLLQAYEPVLRFSAGERFFPMDVLDFIAHSQLKQRRRLFRPDADVTDEWRRRAAGTSGPSQGWYRLFRRPSPPPAPAALAQQLSRLDGTYYLSFGYERKGEAGVPSLSEVQRQRAILFCSMLLLMLLPGYGWLSDHIGLHVVSQWSAGDWFQALAAAALVAAWPLIQVDRKAYFAVGLAVISGLFFGTPFGYVVTLVALVVGLGFLLTCGLLALADRLWEKIAHRAWYRRLQTYAAVLRLGAELAGLAVAIAVMARLWDLWASGGPARLGWAAAGELFVLGLLTLLGWFVLGARLSRILQRRQAAGREQAAVVQQITLSIIDGQQKPMWVLVVAVAVQITLGLAALQPYPGAGAVPLAWSSAEGLYGLMATAMPWLRMSIVSLTAILWYAFDPLPILKPGFLYVYDHFDRRLAWNGRLISYCLLAILVWAGFQFLAMWLKSVGSIHQVTLYYLTLTLTLVFIGLVLGMRLMSALLDAISAQPDLSSDYVAKEYQDLVETRLADVNEETPGAAKDCRAGPGYYGRVCEGEGWTVLQYHYFYAFNDYRSTAGGLNNHEGDWEAVAIFLRQPPGYQAETPVAEKLKALKPYGMAYSQHQAGSFAFWPAGKEDRASEDLHIVKRAWRQGESGPEPTRHPLVYPALGSHANYPRPAEYPASVHFSGSLHKIVAQLDTVFRRVHAEAGVVEPFKQKERVSYMESLARQQASLSQTLQQDIARLQAEQALPARSGLAAWPFQDGGRAQRETDALRQLLALNDEFLGFYAKVKNDIGRLKGLDGGLLLEYAAGDGRRIGDDDGSSLYDEEFRFALQLPPEILSQRRETTPDGKSRLGDRYTPRQVAVLTRWRPQVIDEATPWVSFLGLWGCWAPQADEGGPSGPKWERPPANTQEAQSAEGKVRLRWGTGDPGGALQWMRYLLLEMVNDSNLAVETRQRALSDLVKLRTEA